MSDTRAQRTSGTAVRRTTPEETGWGDFVVFGGVMLMLAGAIHAIAGFTALFKDTYYLVPSSNMVVNVNYTGWGWAHLVIGAAAIAAGIGVMTAQMWARVLGVVVAAVSAVVNLVFLPAYPFWAMVVIAFDLLIIYALIAHGREAVAR